LLELVCPAGTSAALQAAIKAGADSVYCGFRDATNARNYPGLNFDDEEMENAVSFTHAHGRKIFIAINTFARAGNPQPWHRAIDRAAALGVDAIILADIGLLDYAKRHYPDLRRHLSVQAAASNALSIAFYRDVYDVKRVVLPRVLDVPEIAALTKETGVETEVFCFGSVGTMSEGRCFLSSFMTGLSPSCDGVCAPASHVRYKEEGDSILSCLGDVTLNRFARHENAAYPTPCKGRYVTRGQASYLFEEPVGWNAIEILKQLQKAGVTALKIEGRQRSKAYVAQVVSQFRAALDGQKTPASKPLHELAEGSRQTLGAYQKGWR